MDLNDFVKYADILLKIAIRKCKDVTIAEDLVQDTLLAGLVYASSGKNMENPQAWLISVLNNKYYDLLRLKLNKPVVSYDTFPTDLPYESDALQDVVNKEISEEIRKELAHLSRIYREVMVRYYMKDESIMHISKELGVPLGTVKSRLDAGRKIIKKGVDAMESYTNQSYEPDVLHISCSGSSGLNDEPFSTVSNDKIAENILILAYPKPITEVELSKLLGIPTAYVEPIVSKLVNGELVKRSPNGKIYTDFIIFTEADRTNTLEIQKAIVSQHFDLFWAPISKGLKELRQQEFYQRQSKSKQLKLENHFCVNTLLYAVVSVRDKITGGMPYSEYPYRKDGGRWIAMGNMYPHDYDYENNSYWKYLISGEARTKKSNYQNTKYICLAEYDTILGQTPNREVHMSQDSILELLFAVYRGEDTEASAVNPFYFNEIPTMEKLGIVARNNGKATLDIPVLNSSEYSSLKELSKKYLHLISKDIKDVINEVYERGAVKLPGHLTSVPNWQRYMFCDNSIPMMVILTAKEMELFQPGIDYPSPAMIFIVDK